MSYTHINLPSLSSAGNVRHHAGATVALRLPAVENVKALFVSTGGRVILTELITAESLELEGFVDAPSLTTVSGQLTIRGQGTAILTALSHVGAIEMVEHALATGFSQPALARVDGRLSLRGRKLTSVSLPNLISTGGLSISADSYLTAVTLPELQSVS